MALFHEIPIFETVKSKVIISLFETVKLSVSISPRNLYNSLKSIKEKATKLIPTVNFNSLYLRSLIKHISSYTQTFRIVTNYSR